MDLITAIDQYIADQNVDLTGLTREEILAIGARVKENYITFFESLKEFALLEESDGSNIDGGSASSVYLISQLIDGGNAGVTT